MLIKILLGAAVLIAILLLVISFQPATFRVTRTITIAAPPAAIFPQINDFHLAQVWSPWIKLDPAATFTFDGPASGMGASNSWVGNSQMGAGRQTIIESQSPELVRIKIEFIKPMASVSTGEFSLKPDGNQTAVTWSMSGQNNFIAKAFCLFVNQDKMIGGFFEQGLASLKSVVETGGKK